MNVEIATVPWETTSVNLPENYDSAQQQEILDALPALVFLEREGKVVYANTEARHLLGLAEAEWIQRPVEDILWGLFPGTAEPQTHLIGTRRSSPFHATLPAMSGRLLAVEGTYSILNPELRQAVIVAHPSGRERAPKSRLVEDVLASIPEAVVIVHGDHVLYTNPAFTQMFGYTAEEASGGNLRDLIVPETRQHELAMVEKGVDQQGRAAIETVRINKDGELIDVALVVGPLRVDGASVGYVLSFRDIGERRQLEAKLQHDVMYDVLTGLANRALFLDRVSQALSRGSRRRDQECGVLLLDLDRFKEVNDALGHAAGDALLGAVADRLSASVRPQDSAARVGGDEFAVLVENVVDASDLEVVASRIVQAMERPFEIFGSFVRVSASMGVALAGPEPITAEALIRDADFAMYRAKQDGGGCFEIFDKQLEMQPGRSHQEPERELRRLLDQRQFELWYQPIYRLESGKLEGFESLLRWRLPDGSVDSFHDLLCVAEDTGLSITLGRETIDTVCRQLRSWTDGPSQPDLTLTINVTQRQFYHPDMVLLLKKALAANAVDPSRLLFEVAETTLNQNPDAAVDILERMAALYVRIAVDNFGSSLAPLNHLLKMPIDVVKIAPKLVKAATSKGRQPAVLESLIHLGHSLRMEVIAQGIETSEQLDALCGMGCDLGQGHLLSYALEPARAAKLAGLGRWALTRGA